MVSDMKTSLIVGTITFYLSYFDEYMLTRKRAEKAQKTSPYVMAEKRNSVFGLLLLFWKILEYLIWFKC